MKLLCVGLNWKTPVKIRERLTFDGPKLSAALDQLKGAYPGQEFAILSTCNRTELYAASMTDDDFVGVDGLCDFIASFHRIALPEFYDSLYFHEDAGVARHAFTVASGLDSLVLGEGQILGQVRAAYQAAIERQTAGAMLHALFQRALAVAKRVQTETNLSKGRLSIGSAAIDYLKGVFERFDDKTVLVIGAGKMAELTLAHLKELSPKRILLTNRTATRAEELARRLGGETRPFETLFAALIEADIVISSTGAEFPLVDVHAFQRVMRERKQRLTAIVDIAVPRDFDPSIADLENVLLWNIDDLEKIRRQTIRSREAELESALRIIDVEAANHQASLALQESGPVIGRLEEVYQRILDQELSWLLPQLSNVSDADQQRIRQFAHRVKNKFLHPPKAAIKAEARHGTHPTLLEAIRKLFGLHEPS